MRPEEVFDSFYRSTRDDLLHQAFLLTGDVQAAGGAVREAYVTAWQHWSRATRYDDPLDYVRPLAWRYAQRRHRGRIWHRNRGISEIDRSVLDALHKLPATQRRLLVLTEVARLELPAAAREVSLTVEAAESGSESARENLADALSVRPGLIGERLAAVGYASTVSGTLPRTSIVMRAGQKRRRVQGAVARRRRARPHAGRRRRGEPAGPPPAGNRRRLPPVRLAEQHRHHSPRRGRRRLPAHQSRHPEPTHQRYDLDREAHRPQHRRRRTELALPDRSDSPTPTASARWCECSRRPARCRCEQSRRSRPLAPRVARGWRSR